VWGSGRVNWAGRRQFTDASLLYFDLNGFKAINDRFGHPEGDRALQRPYLDTVNHPTNNHHHEDTQPAPLSH